MPASKSTTRPVSVSAQFGLAEPETHGDFTVTPIDPADLPAIIEQLERSGENFAGSDRIDFRARLFALTDDYVAAVHGHAIPDLLDLDLFCAAEEQLWHARGPEAEWCDLDVQALLASVSSVSVKRHLAYRARLGTFINWLAVTENLSHPRADRLRTELDAAASPSRLPASARSTRTRAERRRRARGAKARARRGRH